MAGIGSNSNSDSARDLISRETTPHAQINQKKRPRPLECAAFPIVRFPAILRPLRLPPTKGASPMKFVCAIGTAFLFGVSAFAQPIQVKEKPSAPIAIL